MVLGAVHESPAVLAPCQLRIPPRIRGNYFGVASKHVSSPAYVAYRWTTVGVMQRDSPGIAVLHLEKIACWVR